MAIMVNGLLSNFTEKNVHVQLIKTLKTTSAHFKF